jgi:hypothetical protein
MATSLGQGQETTVQKGIVIKNVKVLKTGSGAESYHHPVCCQNQAISRASNAQYKLQSS